MILRKRNPIRSGVYILNNGMGQPAPCFGFEWHCARRSIVWQFVLMESDGFLKYIKITKAYSRGLTSASKSAAAYGCE